MRYNKLHEWPENLSEAAALQQELRNLIRLDDEYSEIKLIAGIDVGFPEPEICAAGVVVLTFPGLDVVETQVAEKPVTFPYIPGFLAFRETPAVLAALEHVQSDPDILMLDGQGIAHPRRFGIACHVGLLVDKPSIGCAKSKLVGEYEEPGYEACSWTPLTDKSGEVIGSVLRTRDGTNPLFISPGHKVSIESATYLTMQCVRSRRLPEPTRLAHNLVSKQKIK